MKAYLSVLVLGVFFLGCEQRFEQDPPDNLISESTYIDVYVELHLFNALIEAVDTLSNQDSLKAALFDKYGVVESEFLDSHAFYQSQTQNQQVRLDTAIARLARTLEALNEPRIIQSNPLIDNAQGSRSLD